MQVKDIYSAGGGVSSDSKLAAGAKRRKAAQAIRRSDSGAGKATAPAVSYPESAAVSMPAAKTPVASGTDGGYNTGVSSVQAPEAPKNPKTRSDGIKKTAISPAPQRHRLLPGAYAQAGVLL